MFAYSQYSLDATDNERLGRYVNDEPSRSAACNCFVKKMFLLGQPRILVFAKKSISAGTELRYDYGGGAANLPWRKVVFYPLVKLLSFLSINHAMLFEYYHCYCYSYAIFCFISLKIMVSRLNLA